MAVCWTALKGMRLGTMGAYGEGRYDVWNETRGFLRLAIWKELADYFSLSRTEVLLRGLREEFNFVPQRVHNAVVDEVRKRCVRRDIVEVPLSVVTANWGNSIEGGTGDGITGEDRMDYIAYHQSSSQKIAGQRVQTDPLEPTARYISPDELLEQIRLNRDELLRRMGLREIDTLEILAKTIAAGEPAETQRERKGILTQAIAKARGVSERQARKDKDALFDRLRKSGQLGESLLYALTLRDSKAPWRWPWVTVQTIGQREMEQIAYGNEYQINRARIYAEMFGRARHPIDTDGATDKQGVAAPIKGNAFVFDGYRIVPFRSPETNKDSEKE